MFNPRRAESILVIVTNVCVFLNTEIARVREDLPHEDNDIKFMNLSCRNKTMADAGLTTEWARASAVKNIPVSKSN